MSNIFKPYDEFSEYAKEILDDYRTYLAMVPQD